MAAVALKDAEMNLLMTAPEREHYHSATLFEPEWHDFPSNMMLDEASMNGASLLSVVEFSRVANIDVSHHMIIHFTAIRHYHEEKVVDMKGLLDIDTKDLAFMVGLSSLAGSALSEASKALLSQPPHSAVSIAVVLATFIGGRFISDRLRHNKHG